MRYIFLACYFLSSSIVFGAEELNMEVIGQSIQLSSDSINGVFIDDDLVYLTCTDPLLMSDFSSLHIMDVSDKSNPTIIGTISTHGLAGGIYVHDNYAYVADTMSGLMVIDISDPRNPIEVGFHDTPDCATGLYVSDRYVYVADCLAGLRVIDISDPRNPTEVGFYNPLYEIYDVFVSGNHAHIAAGGRLGLIDISEPKYPKELGVYDVPIPFVGGIYASDDYVYVFGWGFCIFRAFIVEGETALVSNRKLSILWGKIKWKP